VKQLLRRNLIPKLSRPMATDRHAVTRRASIVAGFLTLCMLGLGYKAHAIGVTQHETYADLGNRQQLRSFKLDASRGEILDRSHMALAINNRVHKVVVNPRLVRAQNSQEQTIAALLEYVPDLDVEAVRSELARDKAYRKLRVTLDDEQAKSLMAHKLPGVRLEPASERVYPRGHLAAHVLGRLNGQGVGNLGIEHSLEEDLRGRKASSPATFANGKKLLINGYPDSGVSRGNTVVLTLDSAIQAMVEKEIDDLVAAWNPVGASIIVMDPDTGEILALSNRPTFDPNHPVEQLAQTTNLASQAAYEPGSTMKAITVAAALEEGVIRENETLYCEKGRWRFTKRNIIRDTHRSEWLDITQILAESSNICTTKIAMRLGKQAQYRWAQRFHFGDRPEVKLPGATRGLLAKPEKWSDIQAANISFGHGMSTSPLQVTSAFSVLANKGLYNAPAIIQRVFDSDGEVVYEHKPTRERVVRRATAQTVLRMLESVVHSKHGTGKSAGIPGYRVAGKTSTAQKADLKNRGYTDDQYYASFVGAVPARNPRIVILVSVDNPEGGHFGNEVAAPSFSRLGGQIMVHLGIPPDEGGLPQPKPMVVKAAPVGGAGQVVVAPQEESPEPLLPGRRPKKVVVTTGVPDFTGLTIAQVLDTAQQARLEVDAVGTGLAVMQDLAPGSAEENSRVRVFFEPPRG